VGKDNVFPSSIEEYKMDPMMNPINTMITTPTDSTHQETNNNESTLSDMAEDQTSLDVLQHQITIDKQTRHI
jgi:hypothetical protein